MFIKKNKKVGTNQMHLQITRDQADNIFIRICEQNGILRSVEKFSLNCSWVKKKKKKIYLLPRNKKIAKKWDSRDIRNGNKIILYKINK